MRHVVKPWKPTHLEIERLIVCVWHGTSEAIIAGIARLRSAILCGSVAHK